MPTVQLHDPLLQSAGINLFIKRIDLTDPYISGNKWYKLKYTIKSAIESGKAHVITFGGAYSNHILALAAVGHQFRIKTTGIIRGEPTQPLNPTLDKASRQFGMQLYFVSRKDYRAFDGQQLAEQLNIKEGLIIPEGGTNELAIKGCMEILDENDLNSDFICCSVGTGGTLAGMILGGNKQKNILGFQVLKGDFLKNEIQGWLNKLHLNTPLPSWSLNTDYHFGGYAKHKPELIDFINDFKRRHQVSLDPIYTGKMMFGVFDLISKQYFKPGSTITCIHTGGLQGIEGFNQRFGKILN